MTCCAVENNGEKSLTFSATGDSINLRPVPKEYEGFSKISEYIQSADGLPIRF